MDGRVILKYEEFGGPAGPRAQAAPTLLKSLLFDENPSFSALRPVACAPTAIREGTLSGAFDVNVNDLKKAADAAQDVSDEVSGVAKKLDISGIRQGMPASNSGPEAVQLQTSWRADLTAWAHEMGDYAHSLSTSARSYSSTDHQTAELLRSAGRGLGGQ